MLEPGEKAHFTVFGEQNWNFHASQPDWDQSTVGRFATVERISGSGCSKRSGSGSFYMHDKLFRIKPISTEVETASYNGN